MKRRILINKAQVFFLLLTCRRHGIVEHRKWPYRTWHFRLVEEVVVGGEGGHDVAIVGLGEAVKGGDRPGHLVGGEETHDADLGEAAVVEL